MATSRDYASVIDAFVGLYELTFDQQWLLKARDLTEYCIENFHDQKSGMFFFTSKIDDIIIRRTLETSDNVIPASQTLSWGKICYDFPNYFPEKGYDIVAMQMLKNLQANFANNAHGHANWMQLALFVCRTVL